MNIVPTNVPYTYSLMRQNLTLLKSRFPFIKIELAGKSVLKRNIYAVRLGKGPRTVFYSASFHANEYITTILLMKFIEEYCDAYVSKSSINGVSIQELYNSTSIYLVPMVNPDGVDLVNNAFPKTSYPYIKAKKITDEFPNIAFPNGWKANINGVDLNLQYPAEWEQAKKIKYAQGYNKPAPRDFVGFGPLTEPEALSIYNYTLAHNFSLVIAYHTQGKEIYWNFQNINPKNGYEIGRIFAASSGYELANVPYNSSFAGYKDWFIQEYRKPGFTIEAGAGTNPLPLSQFDQIYKNNIDILLLKGINNLLEF